MANRLLENGSRRLLEGSVGARLLESGAIALFLPCAFTTTLLSGYDTDPFGIDAGQTVLLSSSDDPDPFGIDPGQTTPIAMGLD